MLVVYLLLMIGKKVFSLKLKTFPNFLKTQPVNAVQSLLNLIAVRKMNFLRVCVRFKRFRCFRWCSELSVLKFERLPSFNELFNIFKASWNSFFWARRRFWRASRRFLLAFVSHHLKSAISLSLFKKNWKFEDDLQFCQKFRLQLAVIWSVRLCSTPCVVSLPFSPIRLYSDISVIVLKSFKVKFFRDSSIRTNWKLIIVGANFKLS